MPPSSSLCSLCGPYQDCYGYVTKNQTFIGPSRLFDIRIVVSRYEFSPNFYFMVKKVSLWIPIVFIMICCFLVFMPIYVRPYEVGAGLLITATGIPAYFIGIYWENKPEWLKSFSSTGQFHLSFSIFISLFS